MYNDNEIGISETKEKSLLFANKKEVMIWYRM